MDSSDASASYVASPDHSDDEEPIPGLFDESNLKEPVLPPPDLPKSDFFPEEAPPMDVPDVQPKPYKGRGPCKTVWMFTVPNYSEQDISHLQRMGKEECVYMCFGKEIAPTTGTPHLQGFCILKRKQYHTYFRSAVGKQCWPVFDRVRGSPEANKKYCSKTRIQVLCTAGTPPPSHTCVLGLTLLTSHRMKSPTSGFGSQVRAHAELGSVLIWMSSLTWQRSMEWRKP